MVFLKDAGFRLDAVVGYGRAELRDEDTVVFILNVYLYGYQTPVTISYLTEAERDADFKILTEAYAS